MTALPRSEPIRALDLGPAVPENFAFLAGAAGRIQILDALRDTLDPGFAIRSLKKLAPELEYTFHLVLMWDYLNYLTPDQSSNLVEAITPLCRPDARCLAIVYSAETMPARPVKYRVADRGNLIYERSTTDLIGAPQLTPAAVEAVLDGFSIEHAFVLRNGVREYVAVRDAASKMNRG